MNTKPHKYYAFFDVDGTLINIKSMASFLKYYYKAQSGSFLGSLQYLYYVSKFKMSERLGVSREILNKNYYRLFKDKRSDDIKALIHTWFSGLLSTPSIFIHEVLEELKKHQENKAKIVLVSGSFIECLQPFAEVFGADHVLAIQMEKHGNLLTGNIVGYQTIGQGKADVIRDYLRAENFDELENCYAYGDHHTDIPMLNLVGHPTVVSGDVTLENYAANKRWSVVNLEGARS